MHYSWDNDLTLYHDFRSLFIRAGRLWMCASTSLNTYSCILNPGLIAKKNAVVIVAIYGFPLISVPRKFISWYGFVCCLVVCGGDWCSTIVFVQSSLIIQHCYSRLPCIDYLKTSCTHAPCVESKIWTMEICDVCVFSYHTQPYQSCIWFILHR